MGSVRREKFCERRTRGDASCKNTLCALPCSRVPRSHVYTYVRHRRPFAPRMQTRSVVASKKERVGEEGTRRVLAGSPEVLAGRAHATRLAPAVLDP